MQLEFGGQRISVASGQLLVGSDLAAAIRLAGDDVLPRHAIVRAAGDGSLIIEPATAGASLTVNGTSTSGDPTPLLHGDRVRVGSHEIVVVDPVRGGPTQMIAKLDQAAPRPAPVEAVKASASSEPASRLVCLNDGREYYVNTVPFVFGRDAGASIVIGSPDASRHHAEVVTTPEGDVLVDLSSNGTFVNAERINGRHPLKPLDVIRIGAEEFRFYPVARPKPATPPVGAEFRLGDTLMGLRSFPTPPSLSPKPAEAKPLALLLTKSGAAKGQRFSVHNPVANLGRAEFNDVRVADPSVSAGHAKLQLREGVWTLTDLGSTNGTWVDDERVDDETPLSPGATIRLGEVSFAFEPKDERPVRADRTALMAAPAVAPPASSAPVAAPTPAATRRPAPPKPAPAPRSGPSRILLVVAIVVLVATLAALALLG
ncbi:MAG: FHA domain-containing protein [Gemmatimonadales bacterium]